MKFYFLLFSLLIHVSFYAQSSHSVYFETGSTAIDTKNTKDFLAFLNQFKKQDILSLTINIYNDDTGDKDINDHLSEKRAIEIKKILAKNGISQNISIENQGVIKIENSHLFSVEQLHELRDKNRRADIILYTKNGNNNAPATRAYKFTASENKYVIHYNGEDTIVPELDDLNMLLNAIKKLDSKTIQSLSLNVYNDDSGNKAKNKQISKNRAEGLKHNIQNDGITLNLLIVYKEDIKTSVKPGYSKQHSEFLKNKNRRIEIVINYKGASKQAVKSGSNNNVTLKKHTFSEKNSKFTVYYDGADVIKISDSDLEELLEALQTIDKNKVKSISLNVYNDDTDNSAKDDLMSKKRAEELLFLLTKNTNIKLIPHYKGNIKADIKPGFAPKHVEYLKTKNRRIDVVANYNGARAEIDLDELGLKSSFSSTSRIGDRIYLKNAIFPDDRSTMTKDIARELDILAMQLAKFPNLQVEIQGHICCTNGGHEAIDKATGKLELSANRAKVVYQYLVSKNIDPRRLRFKGFGNKKPLGEGIDEQLNKRIELFIYKSSQ